jgi:hypothetical protein
MDDDDIDEGIADAGVLEENDALVRLAVLKAEHEVLDSHVLQLQAETRPDQIQIARLKKRKLVLRDEIVRIEDQLTPDIIA